jgi:hypothetical protein
VSRFLARLPLPTAVSRFVQRVADVVMPATVQPVYSRPRSRFSRIVTKAPIVSKFIAFFVPETLTLELKACDAETREAEAGIKRAAAPITTPPLKPRFNKPRGPRL